MRAWEYAQWAQFLLNVGEGRLGKKVRLLDECIVVDLLYNLILYTFQRSFLETEFDGSMCIRAPTNKLCDEVNDLIMRELPGILSKT